MRIFVRMGIRSRINICIFFVLAVLLTACDRDADKYYVDFFSVAGVVYGASEDTDDIPVQGITIQLDAYASDDLGMKSPLFSSSCLSSSEGRYQFSVSANYNLFDAYFVFHLKDESTFRDSHFEPAEMLLYLRPTSPFFNSSMKSYEVTGNDFYLCPSGD